MTLARTIARSLVNSRFDAIPSAVRHEATRAFVNWLGCVLGGCNDRLIFAAMTALEGSFGAPVATVVGHDRRVDAPNAALLNSLSTSIHAFDDTHSATIIHPTRSVASALMAVAESRAVTGAEFLHALILGIDIECRVGRALMVTPASVSPGFLPTGLTGALGAAAAIGKMSAFDEPHLVWALSLAAGTASGLREVIGSDAALFFLANAARNGLIAARMAESGMTGSETVLEGPKGLLVTYAVQPNPAAILDELNQRYELSDNRYKPYPCGVWVHPTVDVCLELAAQSGSDLQSVDALQLTVNPEALAIAGRKDPTNRVEAQASLWHWAAAVIIKGRATLAEASDSCVRDERVVAMRQRIDIVGDRACAREAAKGALRLADGRVLRAEVEHCSGSQARPMTDSQISEKFLGQACRSVTDQKARELLSLCWAIERAPDVGAFVRKHLASR